MVGSGRDAVLVFVEKSERGDVRVIMVYASDMCLLRIQKSILHMSKGYLDLPMKTHYITYIIH